MNKIVKFVRHFQNNESGASLIEYTALAGILVAVTAAVFTDLGSDIGAKWVAIANFF